MQNKSQIKKILIDARMYGTGNAGIGRSIEGLIRGLARIPPQPPLSLQRAGAAGGLVEYHLFLTKENFEQVDFLPDNWHKVLVDVRWYTLKEQLIIPREIKKIKPDLVYFPHFNVPLLISASSCWLLPNKEIKFILTIHDLIWLKYPRPRKEISTLGPILYWVKNFFSKIVFRSAVKRAEKIVVPTEFTKKEIVDFYDVDSDKPAFAEAMAGKIEVVGWGAVSQKHKNTKTQKQDDHTDNILKKCYNINKPYLLYVGSAYPHKNLAFLIEVFKKADLDLQLVLAGKDSYFYQKLKKEVQDLELDDKVIFTGYVDDKKLDLLYKKALAFVFPTLVEGFGFPPLEAMASGVPVISSNATCLPEVLGDAALYFDPNNKEEFKKNILNIVNKELREELAQKGLEQIKKYDWEKCARQYFNILKNNV